MPKVLPDLKPQLIETAKRMLMDNAYEQLSIRALAKECNIATGTVYNYFKNKEELFVGVILEGWNKYLIQMDEECKNADSIGDALAGICRCIKNFIGEYRSMWSKYGGTSVGYGSFSSYHKMLRGQIKGKVLNIAGKWESKELESLADIMAETVLAASVQSDLGEKDIYSLANLLFK